MSKRDNIVADHHKLRLDRNECICPSFIRDITSLACITHNDYFTYTSAYEAQCMYASAVNCCVDMLYVNHGSEIILKELIQQLYVSAWVVQHPTFELFSFYCEHYGKKIIKVDYVYDKVFDIQIPTGKSDYGLYLVSPHNPTGHIFSLDEILKLSNHYKYIIIDEAYINPLHTLHSLPDNCITVRTFSKMGGLTGMRFGVCISNNSEVIHKLNQTRPMFLNTITLKLVYTIIKNQNLLNNLHKEFEQVKIRLSQSGYDIVSAAGNFALLNCQSAAYKGYALKPYCVGSQLFHRLTLTDHETFVSL